MEWVVWIIRCCLLFFIVSVGLKIVRDMAAGKDTKVLAFWLAVLVAWFWGMG